MNEVTTLELLAQIESLKQSLAIKDHQIDVSHAETEKALMMAQQYVMDVEFFSQKWRNEVNKRYEKEEQDRQGMDNAILIRLQRYDGVLNEIANISKIHFRSSKEWGKYHQKIAKEVLEWGDAGVR